MRGRETTASCRRARRARRAGWAAVSSPEVCPTPAPSSVSCAAPCQCAGRSRTNLNRSGPKRTAASERAEVQRVHPVAAGRRQDLISPSLGTAPHLAMHRGEHVGASRIAEWVRRKVGLDCTDPKRRQGRTAQPFSCSVWSRPRRVRPNVSCARTLATCASNACRR